MQEFFKKPATLFFLLGMAVLVWVAGANAFPHDTIFVLGDYATPIESSENFSDFVRDGQGRGVLWYGLYAVADVLGLDSGAQLTVYVFLFLLFSYVSMWWALGKMFGEMSWATRSVFSLLYATNIFTLNLFLSGELFAVSSILYPVLPAFLSGLFLFVRHPGLNEGLSVLIFFFLASMAFLSPASAVGMMVFFALAGLWFFVFFSNEWRGAWVKNLIMSGVLIVFLVGVSVLWMWPTLLDIRFGESPFVSRELTVPGWRAVEGSTPLSSSLRWVAYPIENKFPAWFPYESWEWSRWIVVVLTCIPLAWLFLSWAIQTKNKQEKRLFWALVSLLGVLVALMARELWVFAPITNMFYSLPGLKTLVSSGTLVVFVPALMILIGAWLANVKEAFRKPITVSALLVMLVALPLFLGSLHTNASPILGDEWEKDKWQESRPSAVVRIPEEVWRIRKILADQPKGKVAVFPYDTHNGAVGWEYIRSWGVWGNIDYEALWNRETLRANRPYVDRWIHAHTFATSEQDPEWLVAFLGVAGVSHIVWHGEIDPEGSYREKIDSLERNDLILSVYEGEKWGVWAIDPAFVYAPVEIVKKNLPLTENPSSLNALSNNIRDVERLSRICEGAVYSRNCSVKVNSDDEGKILMWSQPFHGFWWATLVRENGTELPLRHIRAFGFFNGWQLPGDVSQGDRVDIRYSPEKWVLW